MTDVWLRPWRASDAADVAQMVGDEHVSRWSTNRPSVRLAERIGAVRREPPRTETDRAGTERTLVVYPVTLPWRRVAT